jgi:hypothetical protein
MFEINPGNRMTVTEQLLYNIWQELQELNCKKIKNEDAPKEELKRKKVQK